MERTFSTIIVSVLIYSESENTICPKCCTIHCQILTNIAHMSATAQTGCDTECSVDATIWNHVRRVLLLVEMLPLSFSFSSTELQASFDWIYSIVFRTQLWEVWAQALIHYYLGGMEGQKWFFLPRDNPKYVWMSAIQSEQNCPIFGHNIHPLSDTWRSWYLRPPSETETNRWDTGTMK